MTHESDFQYCPYDGNKLQMDDGTPGARPTCSTCDFTDYQNPKACVAILITKRGKLLLARRGIEPARGEWDIPGGFVDRGESAEEAVVREALEETTLRVRVVKYLGSVPDVYGPKQTPTINLCFLVQVLSGEPEARSDVEKLAWFAMEKLPNKMAFAHQNQVIEFLRREMRGATGD